MGAEQKSEHLSTCGINKFMSTMRQ